MKKTLSILFALFITLSLSAQKRVKGNGNISKETRTTESYDKISCAGSFDYILVAGNEGTITIEGEENLLEYIITKVKNGELTVKVKDFTSLKTSNNMTIKITIPFQEINEVNLAGSGDLWNEDIIEATAFETSLAGSGDLTLHVKTTSVEGNIAGSGDLTLKGQTTNLEVNLSGSGDFHGFDLDSDNTEVAVAGSGDASVVSNKFLKASVAGSGDIEYKGNPEKVDTNVSGSGSISM